MGHKILDTNDIEAPPQDDTDAGPETFPAERASTAIDWFRKGLAILEPYETNQGSVIEWKKTKMALMQGLAQACLAASSLNRAHLDTADSVVRQLIEDKDLQAHDRSQTMRYIMILLLKMKGASPSEITTVLEDIVKGLIVTEVDVNKLIGEVAALTGTYNGIAGGIYVKMIDAMVQQNDIDIWTLVHRVAIALLLHLQARVMLEPEISRKLAGRALKGTLPARLEDHNRP